MEPTLFIGVPVYNGERFLSTALDSLRSQTYTSWKLVISDNASTDNTQAIGQHYADADPRIQYIRQATNVGAMPNFRFLLEMADTPYFMWAAADDMWRESFIEACIMGLEAHTEVGWAFTNMVNIDSFGRVIRDYPSFAKFVNDDRAASVTRYALDPEPLGKANLIYGVYRIQDLKPFMTSFLDPAVMHFPAADTAFNLGILCRTPLYIDERALFCKRIARSTDIVDKIDPYDHVAPYLLGMLRAQDFTHVTRAALLATADTPYANLITAINQYRAALIDEIAGSSLNTRPYLMSIIQQRLTARASREWKKVQQLFRNG